MTENEQIEEMALAICKSRGITDVDDCEKCWRCDNGCLYQEIANGLYNKGYRKVERGEWKLGKSGCMYFCPKCNYAAHPREAEEWDFCPRCGADMRGEKE